jgi:hypothetical protein
MEKISKYYLEESYIEKETEIQAGFRAGRSIIDHVFVIKKVIEKTNNNRKEDHFTFVDREKTYNTKIVRSIGRHGK